MYTMKFMVLLLFLSVVCANLPNRSHQSGLSRDDTILYDSENNGNSFLPESDDDSATEEDELDEGHNLVPRLNPDQQR